MYYELYDLRKDGLTPSLWENTVDRLWKWQAIRSRTPPNTKKEISERGLEILNTLQAYYSAVLAKVDNEPVFYDFTWAEIEAFFNKLAWIKGSSSPTFPSKLGHFIFPKLFIIMDQQATGVENYGDFWSSMSDIWNSFNEKQEAEAILKSTISECSRRPVHVHYPFEVKIIELCRMGQNHPGNNLEVINSDRYRQETFLHRKKPKDKEFIMEWFDEKFSCEHCQLSIRRLKGMAEKGGNNEMFTTFAGEKPLNIYEVDTIKGYIQMRRSTQNLTGKLNIKKLIDVHNRIHSGEIVLEPTDIDKVIKYWGNYAGALLKHLGCRRIV